MNDLLQRLVERTRAPGAAVEPLLPPRYAAAVSTQSGIEEVERQSEGPALAASAVEPNGETPTGFLWARETSAAERTAKVSDQDVSAANGEQLHSQSEFLSDSTSASGRRSSESFPQSLRHQSALRASDIVPVRGKGEAVEQRREDELDGDFQSARIPELSPETSARHPVRGWPPTEFTPRGEASSNPQPVQDASVASPRSNEVTISIGHIEVRNTPPTARARKPAFRPRVTLAEFLKRKNDGVRQ